MISKPRLAALLFAAVFLSGCLPEERVWWSPLGDRALVLIDDHLHLTDADGRLGARLSGVGSFESALVKTVSWLPDGSGFVAQFTRSVPRWDDLRALVPDAELRSVEAMLPLVLPLLDAASASRPPGSPDQAASTLSTPQLARFKPALRRLHEQQPDRVEASLRALPDGAKWLAALQPPSAGYEISETVLFKLAESRVSQVSRFAPSLLQPALHPRLSPRHDALALLRLSEDGEHASLEVLALDGGGPPLTVAQKVGPAFDWTPDGRSLVFTVPLAGEGDVLHTLHRRTVLQENGALMKPSLEKQPDGRFAPVQGPDRLADPVTLATAVTLNQPMLRVLPDARILFAGVPVTLPMTGDGSGLLPRLFLLAADGASITPVPTAPGDLPSNLAHVAPSPDGRYAAVVEGETDAVAVVDLDSGQTRIISPPHPRWKCRTLPAWKSPTELTFAALHDGAPSWMLWDSRGQTRLLSSGWPAAATAPWLDRQREDTPPPATPSLPASPP